MRLRFLNLEEDRSLTEETNTRNFCRKILNSRGLLSRDERRRLSREITATWYRHSTSTHERAQHRRTQATLERDKIAANTKLEELRCSQVTQEQAVAKAAAALRQEEQLLAAATTALDEQVRVAEVSALQLRAGMSTLQGAEHSCDQLERLCLMLEQDLAGTASQEFPERSESLTPS